VADAEFVNQAVDFQEDDSQSRWVDDVLHNSSQTLGDDKPAGAARNAFDRAITHARRSSITFRFEKGSAQLDNRALQDVGRLSRFLASAPGKRFFIVGFADSTGSWGANLNLAAQRAAAVIDELRKAGTRVPQDSILSFSYLAPVACNDTDAGAAKNRRVEVWIAR
jgi:phosphate transport system substrate-binding protein